MGVNKRSWISCKIHNVKINRYKEETNCLLLYVCFALFKNYFFFLQIISFINIIWPTYSKVLFVWQPLKFNTLKHTSVLCSLKPNLLLTCLFFYFSNHRPSVCLVLFCRISLLYISKLLYPLFFCTFSPLFSLPMW